MNDIITPEQLLGFEKKKVKDLEPYYEEDKDQLEEKREVKTDKQQTSITRGQISHFRTEFYDGILKVGEFTSKENEKDSEEPNYEDKVEEVNES